MTEKDNTMGTVYNTHIEVEAGKDVSTENCSADETVNMNDIIEDNIAIESDMHHIEPLEVLHDTLQLEEYEMGHSLLKIILSNLQATSKESSCSL